ncbi:hypothetical protein RQP53_05515 [Paucibacter sp. APW11]|uniref:Type 4 fimbrial biogenesis protein PilX N-terminal domain-containing protein n=1 Tax=Roseateles aquae TaxID=3077235 RepID=A0ABU3P819_9BURK|nr:hypothetical protein [Paucibacter sp. APW11]MDT8998724.1 hypothetical protein [Paucibacter sp. APW11]
MGTMRVSEILSPRRQRGAATLLVVMVLFFVMALVAAGAGRSIFYDQKITTNYGRADVANEAAIAGIDWTFSQLNGLKINSSCTETSSGPDRFAERYLQFTPTASTDRMDPKLGIGIIARCASSATGAWTCECNSNGAINPPTTLPAGKPSPAFVVRMAYSDRGSTAVVRVFGCTSPLTSSSIGSDTCNAADQTGRAEGVANRVMQIDAGLIPALRVPPASPLIAQGLVNWGAAGSSALVQNTDPARNGLIAQIGDSQSGSTAGLQSLPGTPVQNALITDPGLLNTTLTYDAFFQRFFAMTPATYRTLPAVRIASCPTGGGDCSSAISTLFTAGARMIWIDGNATVSSALTLGTVGDPAVLIVDGNLQISGGFKSAGVVVAKGALNWTGSTAGLDELLGSLVVGGDTTFTGPVVVNYVYAPLRTLATRRGSFVPAPGSLLNVTL